MDDLFSPPGTPWRPVSPQLRRLRRAVLSGLVASGLVVVAVLAVTLGWPVTWSAALAVVLLVVLGAGWWLIEHNVRAWGYAERDDDLYIKHGAMFRQLVAVPYGRMQYVDVNAGPFEQMYGIASVRLHTASPRSGAKIPGLPADEAARLRDRLTELGESQAAGL